MKMKLLKDRDFLWAVGANLLLGNLILVLAEHLLKDMWPFPFFGYSIVAVLALAGYYSIRKSRPGPVWALLLAIVLTWAVVVGGSCLTSLMATVSQVVAYGAGPNLSSGLAMAVAFGGYMGLVGIVIYYVFWIPLVLLNWWVLRRSAGNAVASVT